MFAFDYQIKKPKYNYEQFALKFSSFQKHIDKLTALWYNKISDIIA